MMRRGPLALAFCVLCGAAYGQAEDDSTLADMFWVFDTRGETRTLTDLVEAANGVEVVYVGEEHGDSIGHLVEAKFFEMLAEKPAALSLEMFERDVQVVVDEYLADLITEAHFLRSARPWPRYGSDYRPLVELAKRRGLGVIASNAPRRYVNRVTRLGTASLDSLDARARAWLPPLPLPDPHPAYRKKWDDLLADMADSLSTHAADSAGGPPYLFEAQALWDAAMAHSIQRQLNAHPKTLVVHVTGSFHVESGLGTPHAVRAYRPGTQDLVVILRSADDAATFDEEAHGHLGDYVVQTPAQPDDG